MNIYKKYINILKVIAIALIFGSSLVHASETSIELNIVNPGTTDFGTSPITNPAIPFIILNLDVAVPNALASPGVQLVNPNDSYNHNFTLPTVVCPVGTSIDACPASSTITHSDGVNDTIIITLRENISSSVTSDINRYEIVLILSTNFDVSTRVNTLAANEDWNIMVVGAGMGIEAACPVSFYSNVLGSSPLVELLVPGESSPPAPFGTTAATITASGSPWVEACANLRPGVDVVMVLDKSGSMGWSTGSSRARVEVLRDAVEDFVETWKDIREIEAGFTPPIVNTDNIGIVFFDSNASAWAGLPSDLNNFSSVNCDIANADPSDCSGVLTDDIDAVIPGGSTSIGDGLIQADAILGTSAAGRKAILLMSDGMQNTSEMVFADITSNEVSTHPTSDPTALTLLTNQADYNIYSVTIGPGAVVSPLINQNIASATGGFYVNAEDDPELLRPFFIELLQNFLRFSSIETVRLLSGEVSLENSYETDIPVTSASAGIIVNVFADSRHGLLSLTLTPPGGGNPIVNEGSGAIRISQSLINTQNPEFVAGIWKARVDLVAPVVHASVTSLNATQPSVVPFKLIALEDNLALKSLLEITTSNHVVGDNIKLQVQLSELGQGVVGLNTQPGAEVSVKIVQPGEALGDLLSESGASTDQPTPGDQSTNVEAMLNNAMSKDPDFLKLNKDNSIPLLDNGNSSNGDDTANDGIYTATLPTTLAGHYSFLFTVKGQSQTGNFSRQQIKTIYVKVVPDSDSTEVESSIKQADGSSVLTIIFTPKTSFGNKLGPGWQNYFWFKGPEVTPFKAKDNQDGSYTATLGFSGNTPPVLSLHFLDIAQIIDDSVTHDALPLPLDADTTLLEDINQNSSGDNLDRYFWFILIVILLIILFIFLRRSSSP
jgi:hypothetical protein